MVLCSFGSGLGSAGLDCNRRPHGVRQSLTFTTAHAQPTLATGFSSETSIGSVTVNVEPFP